MMNTPRYAIVRTFLHTLKFLILYKNAHNMYHAGATCKKDNKIDEYYLLNLVNIVPSDSCELSFEWVKEGLLFQLNGKITYC